MAERVEQSFDERPAQRDHNYDEYGDVEVICSSVIIPQIF